jgi:inorganic triphosphatase YgiF
VAVSTQVEVEVTVDVDPSFEVTEVLELPGLRVEEPQEHGLEATYFDTADLMLLRHRTTLRRRTGGVDAGWHLKLPAPGGARLEVHRALGRSARVVPVALSRLVVAHTRGAELLPVARLTTRRVAYRLLDDDGTPVVEVADDTVVAEVLPVDPDQSLVTSTWREVEVEQLGPDGRAAAEVAASLVAAGARPAANQSKLGRALAVRLDALRGTVADHGSPGPDGAGPAVAEPTSATPAGLRTAGAARSEREAGAARRRRKRRKDAPPTVGELVVGWLREQVLQVQCGDPAVRLDAEQAGNRMRDGLLRLLALLDGYRPLLDQAVTDPLREELRWLAELLTPEGDATVLRARLRAAVAELPPELAVGPVARRVDTELRGVRRDARTRLLGELAGQRYLDLMSDLDDLADRPPLVGDTDAPARGRARRRTRRAVARLEDAMRGFRAAQGSEHQRRALDELRDAVRRTRCVAELADTVAGAGATRFLAAVTELEHALEGHREAVLAQGLLRDLGMRTFLDGENPFTLGLLHGLQQWAAARDEVEVLRTWQRVSDLARRWPGH